MVSRSATLKRRRQGSYQRGDGVQMSQCAQMRSTQLRPDRGRISQTDSTTMERSAVLSKCRRYRYVLERIWQPTLPRVLIVGLNPSTADAVQDDPTVRRCIGFGRSWGFGGVVLANLFALRSTDPSLLLRVDDPIGPDNDRWLRVLSAQCTMTVIAWGVGGRLQQRADQVLPMLSNIHHLGLTNGGHPRHPLYLPRTIVPQPF